ncbi:B-type lectin plumieribetin-like [Aplochiton taeniatus]
MSKNSISTSQELRKGEFLLNGQDKAKFEDGTFAIYKWSPIWSTNTANGGGERIILQGDQHLAMYDKSNELIWSNGGRSLGSDKMRLTMTNEGVLVVDCDGKKVWSSK